ncbi:MULTISPECIES: hypothetical protein [Serratia]|uniref:hypothetical protein n=1 Tax=Serratia TaxID=613 RepID=UPI000D3EE05C|nr:MULTISPECIES: hypothetical protein [Serratia]AWC81157.1 hypothetical protein AM377_16385 [Serratia marcescens]
MANAMVVFKADRPANNPNLPKLEISEQEIAILKMNPSAWIEAKSGVVSSVGEVSLVRDKTGRANWTPVGAMKPRVIAAGKGFALRFGRAASNSGALIAQGSYESLPADGIYSQFILYRIPLPSTEGYGGTGGNICGNYTAVPDWLRVRFGNDNFQTDAVWLNHGGTAVSDPSNYPINTTIAGFRDNQWHIAAIESTSTFHRWEHDGALLQQSAAPAKPFATAASRQLIIGGAGNPLSHGFQGDIAAKIMIPGVLSVDAKTTLYARFNALKAELVG